MEPEAKPKRGRPRKEERPPKPEVKGDCEVPAPSHLETAQAAIRKMDIYERMTLLNWLASLD